jgi:alpha-tubulin suppressor-like RCC1 family protein
MKLLGVGLVLVTFSARAQHQGPLEGANVVAVLLADSGMVVWQRVVQILEVRGYRLLTRDSTTWRLETRPIQTPELCLTSIQATVFGHTVLLSAKSWCFLLGYQPHPVWYSAKSHVPFANFDCYAWGWNELAAVAKELSGKKVVSFRHP